MKLWQKLSFLVVFTLLITGVLSGAAVIYKTVIYNQEKTLENYEQQLSSAANALSREIKSSPLQSYREATKKSYLTFLVRKYDASEYILVADEEVICNETAFALCNPSDKRWAAEEVSGAIQHSDDSYVFVAGKRLSVPDNTVYKLILVKDISSLYQDMKNQAFLCLLIYSGMAVFSVILVFAMTGKVLQPLFELQRAAKDLSRGELNRRVNVHTRDEIGTMALAFNRMAERIESQVTELEEESERRRQMLGSLAHELKTPMTSIIGYSDSLLHVNLKEKQKDRALHHIYEECRRLERLSGKIMSLIGMYDNDSIHFERTDIAQLFGQVEQLEEYHLKERGIELVSFCNMKERMLDKDLFTSLLLNLIDNAAKASREGGKIMLQADDDTISVTDTGCGIPKEELSRVMEAFYMVDKARSRKEGGSGLGLALCSKIAKIHGAELLIESKVGEGTKVSLHFYKTFTFC